MICLYILKSIYLEDGPLAPTAGGFLRLPRALSRGPRTCECLPRTRVERRLPASLEKPAPPPDRPRRSPRRREMKGRARRWETGSCHLLLRDLRPGHTHSSRCPKPGHGGEEDGKGRPRLRPWRRARLARGGQRLGRSRSHERPAALDGERSPAGRVWRRGPADPRDPGGGDTQPPADSALSRGSVTKFSHVFSPGLFSISRTLILADRRSLLWEITCVAPTHISFPWLLPVGRSRWLNGILSWTLVSFTESSLILEHWGWKGFCKCRLDKRKTSRRGF